MELKTNRYERIKDYVMNLSQDSRDLLWSRLQKKEDYLPNIETFKECETPAIIIAKYVNDRNDDLDSEIMKHFLKGEVLFKCYCNELPQYIQDAFDELDFISVETRESCERTVEKLRYFSNHFCMLPVEDLNNLKNMMVDYFGAKTKELEDVYKYGMNRFSAKDIEEAKDIMRTIDEILGIIETVESYEE